MFSFMVFFSSKFTSLRKPRLLWIKLKILQIQENIHNKQKQENTYRGALEISKPFKNGN